MGTIEDQIREARAQRANLKSKPKNDHNNNNNDDDTNTKNGIEFGTGAGYDNDDANDGEYVTSLPTLDEERRMMRDDDDDYDDKRRAEMNDEGRVGGSSRGSSHPSTLAGMKVSQRRSLTVLYSILMWLNRDYVDYFVHVLLKYFSIDFWPWHCHVLCSI